MGVPRPLAKATFCELACSGKESHVGKKDPPVAFTSSSVETRNCTEVVTVEETWDQVLCRFAEAPRAGDLSAMPTNQLLICL